VSAALAALVLLGGLISAGSSEQFLAPTHRLLITMPSVSRLVSLTEHVSVSDNPSDKKDGASLNDPLLKILWNPIGGIGALLSHFSIAEIERTSARHFDKLGKFPSSGRDRFSILFYHCSNLQMALDVSGGRFPVVPVFNEATHPLVLDERLVEPCLMHTDVRSQFVKGVPFRHLGQTLGSIGILSRYGERFVGVLGRSLGDPNSSPRVKERAKEADRSDNAKPKPPIGPIGRVAGSGSGLPLSAKVGITVLLAALAWPIQFRGLEWFDGIGRDRRRLRGAGLIGLSFGLLGLSAWLWSLSVS
jgi:hypothetical protein